MRLDTYPFLIYHVIADPDSIPGKTVKLKLVHDNKGHSFVNSYEVIPDSGGDPQVFGESIAKQVNLVDQFNPCAFELLIDYDITLNAGDQPIMIIEVIDNDTSTAAIYVNKQTPDLNSNFYITK